MADGVRQLITPERYRHTIGVRDTAVGLAERYGCSTEKAEIAALLHDVARDLPEGELLRIAEGRIAEGRIAGGGEGDAPVPRELLYQPIVLHARVGAIIARTRFGIRDPEILRSIEVHTTAAAGMGLLDRIIFVADYVEPGRTMEDVDAVRALVEYDLDGAVLLVLKSVFRFLLEAERYIISDSIEAYNEIILRRGA